MHFNFLLSVTMQLVGDNFYNCFFSSSQMRVIRGYVEMQYLHCTFTMYILMVSKITATCTCTYVHVVSKLMH